MAKKKKHIVEDHHDDCGEDFGPLGDDYLSESYFEEPNPSSNEDDDLCWSMSWDFGMNGSDFVPQDQCELWEGQCPMMFETMDAFIRWDQDNEHDTVFRKGSQYRSSSPPDDVAQLCGVPATQQRCSYVAAIQEDHTSTLSLASIY